MNYLTSIDEIVVKWHEVAPWLSTLDEFFALVLAMAFVLTNMWVLVPTIRRREKEKKLFMQTPNHRKFQITLGVAPERKKRSVFLKSVIISVTLSGENGLNQFLILNHTPREGILFFTFLLKRRCNNHH